MRQDKPTKPALPTIHVISDSVGITAKTLAQAAASQFGQTDPNIELLANVRSFDEIQAFLEDQRRIHQLLYDDDRIIVFYTLVEGDIAEQMKTYAKDNGWIVAVDLMTDAMNAISQVSGLKPYFGPGGTHVTDEHYFHRIEALEFTIAHDDGLLIQDLPQADIVIIGVSRTSKTPTSIYLGQQGYRVANVPLIAGLAPPKELFKVESSRLFGLITTSEVLSDIRRTRMSEATGASATRYADIELVREELSQARALMSRLDCFIINTQHRAIEETAQEIMRHYDADHPHNFAS